MPGYLIDMDGVIYRGNELIPGADRFIADLREREVPFCFSRITRSELVAMWPRSWRGSESTWRKVTFLLALWPRRDSCKSEAGGTAYVIGEEV